MTTTKKDTPFNIIRRRGTPDRGQLPDGRWVYGQSKFFVEQYNGFIPVAPYMEHFIYKNPDDVKGPVYMCSCGSPGIIVGTSGYILDASPQGLLMVCMMHSSTGVHQGGGSRWV